MGKKVENNKKFLIIHMTIQEAIAAMDCFGECNLCGEACADGYYIPVIHQFYCQTCYDAWISSAIRYRSDIGTEIRRFNAMKRKLEDLGTWDV